jgi:hypothetical protein
MVAESARRARGWHSRLSTVPAPSFRQCGDRGESRAGREARRRDSAGARFELAQDRLDHGVLQFFGEQILFGGDAGGQVASKVNRSSARWSARHQQVAGRAEHINSTW